MGLKTRQDIYKLETNIDTKQIYRTSRLVSDLTGFNVQLNKAVVGGNAFRHSSGLHVDGMLKKSATYEIMDPREVGIPGSSLVLGKTSGRHAFKERLSELGYNLSEEDLAKAFAAFKELADKKKDITDRDIESLVAEERRTVSEEYHLERVQVTCGDQGLPMAGVRLLHMHNGNGEEYIEGASLGTGPVDAVYKAINVCVEGRIS